MTVRELISKLKEMPQDKDVFISITYTESPDAEEYSVRRLEDFDVMEFIHCVGLKGELVGNEESFPNTPQESYGWRNVVNELPEAGKRVLIAIARGVTHTIRISRLCEYNVTDPQSHKWLWSNTQSSDVVTHWMPLPEVPYLEGGERCQQ
jgi:hypothetical protein